MIATTVFFFLLQGETSVGVSVSGRGQESGGRFASDKCMVSPFRLFLLLFLFRNDNPLQLCLLLELIVAVVEVVAADVLLPTGLPPFDKSRGQFMV